MSLTALDRSATPPTLRDLECDSTGALRVTGVSGSSGTSSSGLTNAELRAAAVAVSAQTLPLPAGAATAAKQDVAAASLVSIDSKTPALSGNAVPVTASARTCTGRQTIALTAGVVTTLTVPNGSLAAAIQADGNTVRATLDGVTAPTATVGTRIDDGVIYYVDTALGAVKLFAAVACAVQVAYFDRA